jgi:hypothetical protein
MIAENTNPCHDDCGEANAQGPSTNEAQFDRRLGMPTRRCRLFSFMADVMLARLHVRRLHFPDSHQPLYFDICAGQAESDTLLY